MEEDFVEEKLCQRHCNLAIKEVKQILEQLQYLALKNRLMEMELFPLNNLKTLIFMTGPRYLSYIVMALHIKDIVKIPFNIKIASSTLEALEMYLNYLTTWM